MPTTLSLSCTIKKYLLTQIPSFLYFLPKLTKPIPFAVKV